MKRIFNIWALSLIICSACHAASDKSHSTIALLGDSMTWIGGDECQNERGWSHFLKKAFPDASIKVYARSGATWTNTRDTNGNPDVYYDVLDDENVVYNQVLSLIRDAGKNPALSPDIIILYAGANDAWFEKKRPGIFDDIALPQGSVDNCKPSDFTSLPSSIQLASRKLREHFPDARIILMTPVEMTKVPASKINQIGDIIEKTGTELGLEVLRADKNVDIRHDQEAKKLQHTSDGVHTNSKGAVLIADFVIDYLSNN